MSSNKPAHGAFKRSGGITIGMGTNLFAKRRRFLASQDAIPRPASGWIYRFDDLQRDFVSALHDGKTRRKNIR